MDCIEAQGLINRFIDDKLDEKALTDFLEHVKHCPSCYDDLEATYTVMAVIRLLDEKEETSDYLKVLDHRIEEEEAWLRQQRRTRFFKKMIGATAFIIAAFLLSSMILFLAGNIEHEKHLTVTVSSGIYNPLNLHRKERITDKFLYIRDGDNLKLVYSVRMPRMDVFDSRKADRPKEGWMR